MKTTKKEVNAKCGNSECQVTTKKEVNAKCGNSECQVRMSVELPAYCPICSMNSMVPMVEVREV